jgi:hypothetical protein
VSELLQVMVAKRGILVYRSASTSWRPQWVAVVPNYVKTFRRDHHGRRILIGVGILLRRPRICVSLVWRRP